MRWVRQGLWIAAWAGWGWLGVGLYHELPRKPGILVHELNLRFPDDMPVGFVGNTNRLVVARNLRTKNEQALELFDIDSGKLLRHVPAAGFGFMDLFTLRMAKRYGVVFARHERPTRNGNDLKMLDMATGEWILIGRTSQREIILHDEKPWVAFVEPNAQYPFTPQVVVYDFVAGKRLLVRPNRRDSWFVEGPFFIPGSATFVVPVLSPGEGKTLDDVEFELWNLTGSAVLSKVVKGFRIGDWPSVSATGRVAFGSADPPSIHVFGIEEGRLLFSDLSTDRRPIGQTGAAGQHVGVEISRSGRSIIGQSPKGLWDVDAHEERWRPKEIDLAHGTRNGEHYVVIEQWSKLWKDRFPGVKYTSMALRSLETLDLVHRTAESDWMSPFGWNAARTLGVKQDGSVHRLPYVVNWALLTLCQSILALPLILLWLALLWRRKRRERRLAGAMA